MIALRAAAFLCWLDGVGFGVFCFPAIRNAWMGREVPIVMGFPAYGGGPFESHGLRSTVPLLTAFLLVCALECLAGAMLWGGHQNGAWLAIALLPFGAVFWWGFALPLPPLSAVIRTVLLVVGWRALSP